LRFMGLTSVRNLIFMLEDKMAALGDRAHLRARPYGEEYFIDNDYYGLSYHTWVPVSQVDEETLFQQNEAKLNYLKRKLIEDLEDAEKIFVYKRAAPTEFSEILALHAALNKYGPTKLFWISVDESGSLAGQVEWCGQRVLHGYIANIPADDQHVANSADAWLALCRKAVIAFESVAGSIRP
jgi:hypothetical protein